MNNIVETVDYEDESELTYIAPLDVEFIEPKQSDLPDPFAALHAATGVCSTLVDVVDGADKIFYTSAFNARVRAIDPEQGVSANSLEIYNALALKIIESYYQKYGSELGSLIQPLAPLVYEAVKVPEPTLGSKGREIIAVEYGSNQSDLDRIMPWLMLREVQATSNSNLVCLSRMVAEAFPEESALIARQAQTVSQDLSVLLNITEILVMYPHTDRYQVIAGALTSVFDEMGSAEFKVQLNDGSFNVLVDLMVSNLDKLPHFSPC